MSKKQRAPVKRDWNALFRQHALLLAAMEVLHELDSKPVDAIKIARAAVNNAIEETS
jgi:hypothetical protein